MEIDAVIPQAPKEFKQLCRAFVPDLQNYTASWNELVSFTLCGSSLSEAPVILAYVNEILEANPTAEELKDFWWTMPVSTAFLDGETVREYLVRLRDRLMQPPYSEGS